MVVSRALDLRGEVEGMGLVQPPEEEASGWINIGFPMLQGS